VAGIMAAVAADTTAERAMPAAVVVAAMVVAAVTAVAATATDFVFLSRPIAPNFPSALIRVNPRAGGREA